MVLSGIIILISLGLPFAMGFANQSAYNAHSETRAYAVADELESLILEMQGQISELQFNVQFLWAIVSDDQVDDEILRRQAAQDAVTERLMLQIEYYNVTALLSNSELLERKIILAERYLEVEEVSLSLGETTQLSVDLVYSELNALNRQNEINGEAFRARRQWVDQSRGLPGYEFIRDYTVPVPSSLQANSLSALKTGLVNNNLPLYTIDQQIVRESEFLAELVDMGVDAEIIETVQAEIKRLNAEREFLRNQLELIATNKWLSYHEAEVQYDLAVAMRPALTARLELISLMYDLGEISTVERLRLEVEAYEELHNINLVAISFAVVVAELDVMMQGVVA